MESVRMHLCLPGCAPAKTVLGCLDGVSGVGKYQGEYSYLRDGANDHNSRRPDKQNNNNNNNNNSELKNRPTLPKLKNINRARALLMKINHCLTEYLNISHNLEEILFAIYCAAVTITELNHQNEIPPNNSNRAKRNEYPTPAWKRRLEKNIDEFRSKSDIINKNLHNNRSRKVTNKVADLAKKAGINLNNLQSGQELLNLKDTFRQKSKVKGAKLKRFNELIKRKEQNYGFQNNRKNSLEIRIWKKT